MVFIRRVKTKSGATAIQITHKRYGRIVRIEHIGSAHNPKEEALLINLARQKLNRNQPSLFKSSGSPLKLMLKSSSSVLLRETLLFEYKKLGFDILKDEVFALLTVARIVEPVSKLDSLGVLSDLGLNDIDKNQLYRSLKSVIKKDYRKKISELCFNQALKDGVSLILYDVTTLYFEVQKEDDCQVPNSLDSMSLAKFDRRHFQN